MNEKVRKDWLSDLRNKKKNRKWLKYSHSIARRIYSAIEGRMTQKELSEKLGISQQQISKVMSGSENLTLETIAKISEAIGVELISFPEYKYTFESIISKETLVSQTSDYSFLFAQLQMAETGVAAMIASGETLTIRSNVSNPSYLVIND